MAPWGSSSLIRRKNMLSSLLLSQSSFWLCLTRLCITVVFRGMVCVCVCERERERQTDRQTDRLTDWLTDRQTEPETERERELLLLFQSHQLQLLFQKGSGGDRLMYISQMFLNYCSTLLLVIPLFRNYDRGGPVSSGWQGWISLK